MALVVFLRGVNVGGHRVFRPARLPAQLPHLGLVNIGAAGTFVVRRRVARADLRRELARHLPFEAKIIICDGAQVRALVAGDPCATVRLQPGMVRFVSVLGRAPQVEPLLPMEFREGRRWLVKLVARTDCFVLGLYRRHMKTIGHLGKVDRVFDVPSTVRNWNTIVAVAGVLDAP